MNKQFFNAVRCLKLNAIQGDSNFEVSELMKSKNVTNEKKYSKGLNLGVTVKNVV